ncbi:MAG: hypothetical protein L6V95_07905 [Candidatus Melainabacteria bacterium]|nr:MAG: hypothetical protein L6V95_07905 [Candidatus Melainabacteria bacterium]
MNKLIKTAKHKKNLKIAFYEVWSTINMPNYYVDISQVMEQKSSKDKCSHLSNCYKRVYFKNSWVEFLSRIVKNLEACECFCVLDVKDFSKIIENTFYDL